MRTLALTVCSALLEVGEGVLPAEFRIFEAGWNATTKGRALFDAEAAASVMKAYETHGVDLMIDLNHDSLEPEALAQRADASDARGWFKLELRADGSLWAVDVRWTPDGERRLREKTQRYISPAFAESKHLGLADDARPRKLVNVALCSQPATHDAPALVAASVRDSGAHTPPCYADLSAVQVTALTNPRPMDPEQAKAALEALEKGDAKAALEVLRAILVAAVAGTPPEPATGDPSQENAETPPPAPGSPEEEEQRALGVLSQRVLVLTKCTTAGAALAELEKLSSAIAQLETNAKATELSERRGLIADLVKLRAEFPSTAWEGDPERLIPCKRLADEPIAELRDRVAKIKAAAGAPPPPAPPTQVEGDVSKLSAKEIAHCKKNNIDPKEFAAKKAGAVRRSV